MIVYKIVNKINSKLYVGQTTGPLATRLSAHASPNSGTWSIIKAAFQKYGKHNFDVTVLSACASQEELNNAEVYWIDFLQTQSPFGYNVALGGNNGRHSDESKLKMSKARKGIQKPNSGCWPSVAVTCVETGVTYPSINKAAFEMGLQRANIQKVLYGERRKTGGYSFKKVAA